MDELDKILLQHLPDTGLCERSKIKQEQRRRKLKLAVMGYMMNQARNPNAVFTKEGGVVKGPLIAITTHEMAIDEMQFDGSDFYEDKVTIRDGGVVMMPFKLGCDPLNAPDL